MVWSILFGDLAVEPIWMEAFDWNFEKKLNLPEREWKIVLENDGVSEILYIIFCGHFCLLNDVNEVE